MKKQIEDKLKEIHKAIIDYKKPDKDAEDDNSLYVGSVGVSLFLANYSKFTNNEADFEVFEAELDKGLDAVCNGFYIPSFCSGVSGALYGIKFINENGFSDIDTSEIHQGYAPYLKQWMFETMENKHFDFMHGAIGAALYLLKNGDSDDFDDCIKLVDKLENISIRMNGISKWTSYNSVTKEETFNISMSHGMSSISVFLCRMINMNIDTERCSKLLTETITYILQQEIDHKKYGAYFPSYSIESEKTGAYKSRLGWCYGDLGVAMALWQSGLALNNSNWKDKAIEVLEFAAQRRDFEVEGVIDAGVCHGTAGIAHIFKRIYLETNNPIFEDANKFWIEETLKMSRFDDGLAGYKSWGGKDKDWYKEVGILEGIAGIGLVLLSSISSDSQYSNWDEILLLH